MGQVAAVDVTIPYGPSRELAEFAPRNYIDEIVLGEWRKLGLQPVETCDDSEFIRRAYFDLIGTLPTVEEVRDFLNDNASDKRSKLVDTLLERPEYVDFWSLKWSDLFLACIGVMSAKRGWRVSPRGLRCAVRDNRPIDALVRELLDAGKPLHVRARRLLHDRSEAGGACRDDVAGVSRHSVAMHQVPSSSARGLGAGRLLRSRGLLHQAGDER